jgi:hypothetical protein
MSGLKKIGCGGLCEVSQMLDAGDYVRCLSLGIDASLRSIKIVLGKYKTTDMARINNYIYMCPE